MTLLGLLRKHDELLALLLALAHELKLEAGLPLPAALIDNVALQVQVVSEDAAGQRERLVRLLIAAFLEEMYQVLLRVTHEVASTYNSSTYQTLASPTYSICH